jgi:acyl-CoA thioesterase-1
MRANMGQMVDLASAAGAKVLLLGMRMPPNYGPEYTDQFALVFSDLARARKLPVVPFLLTDIALAPNLLQGDDIHPNAAGQPILLENVWPALKPLLQK